MKEITLAYWKTVRERIATTTDALKNPIDAGIFETVVVLNVLGFQTKMSCEGHLDHGSAAPWIDILPGNLDDLGRQLREARHQAHPDLQLGQGYRPEGAEKEIIQQITGRQKELVKALFNYLDDFYQQRRAPYKQQIIARSWGIEHVRLESLGSATQDIESVEDKAHNLLMYQEEMHAFTDFLKQCIVIMDEE